MSVATGLNKRQQESEQVMRTLRFIIEGQVLTLDPTCDSSDLIPGTENFIRAHFSFSNEWDNCVKVAAFYSMIGSEYAPQQIKEDMTCMIPIDATKRHRFKVQVIGRNKKENSKLCTNKLIVEQGGGN